MQLIRRNNRYVAVSSYDERALPKAAGFRWDPAAKCWWTDRPEIAAKLAQHADAAVRATLQASLTAAHEARAVSVVASRATDADVAVPAPAGLAYLPYQRAGIAYASARPATLIGDDMGLGKTIQALGVANADPTVQSILVVCPASLKLNWLREAAKWLVRPLTADFARGDFFPATQLVVINYDILTRHAAALRARTWDLLIIDEAHALKSAKAQRTRAVLGGGKGEDRVAAIPAKRKLFLTGTPLLNRPNEAWTLLRALDPQGLGGDFWAFHKRYCNAHQTRWGWDMSGASNLGELQRKLRETVMIRRLKSEVLTELPAKRRQVIELAANGSAAVVTKEKRFYDEHSARVEELRAAVELADAAEDKAAYERAVAELKAVEGVLFSEMSELRHATAVAKIPAVIEHLEEAVEASGKVIFFAHHIDVISQIATHFGKAAVVLTGSTSLENRQAAVDRFQTDDSCTLFCGNILAAGVGITLTAAAHVVFGELDWRPAMITQAEDRAHRIGQRASVLVQHLVFDGSLDAVMAKMIIEKQAVIDGALDTGMAAAGTVPTLPAQAAPREAPKAPPAAPAAAVAPMSSDQIRAVLAGLRALAAMDEDRARELNGAGFNRLDGHIGHALAAQDWLSLRQAHLGRRLCIKYRRQLGADALKEMGA